jgi:uncharacterized protein YrzB (UPF0473 family)
MENEKIQVNPDEKIQVEKDGKIIECDVLFTFTSDDTLKTYVGYTDNSFTNGRKNIFVSSIDTFAGDLRLHDITDPRELAMVSDVLESIDREANR